MAYSSVRATLGGRDVKKTTRQVRKPTYSTVSASTGASSYASPQRVSRSAFRVAKAAPSAPTRTSRSASKAPPKPVVPKLLVKQMERHQKEGERLTRELKTEILRSRVKREPPKIARAQTILRESRTARKGVPREARSYARKILVGD